MNTVEQLNDKDYISVAPDSSVNYFEIAGRSATSDSSGSSETFHNWGDAPLQIDNYFVIPNGTSNDIPKQIQEAALPNSLAPRIQNRKIELLIDQGPYLYKEKSKGERKYRKPKEDEAITDWLESFNYRDELTANATDYYYSNIVFTKIFRSRGYRVGITQGKIASLKSVSSFDSRLAYHNSDTRKIPTHVIIGDWHGANSSNNNTFTVYPIFDSSNPLKYPVAVHVSAFKTYGMKDYPLPEIFGALEWIKRNTVIPLILKSLTDNSLNIKWHITSPESFWAAKKKELQEQAKLKKEIYTDKMLTDLRKEILNKLSELLSGVENVGKFWHNVEVTKMIGATPHKEGWDIKPIEQKVKDYVEAQLKISLSSSNAVLASLGLHSALGNVGADGKSDSGAEQVYAYKIHQATSTNLPEYYVCKAFNEAIKYNFKTKKKLGFYRMNVQAEEETTPSKRTKNQNNQ
jgi:hypothetical protein